MSAHENSKRERIRKLLRELLDERDRARRGLPTTGRFLFYELEQRGLATKECKNEKGEESHTRRNFGWPPGQMDVTGALISLREDGTIPWSWIADAERNLVDWQHAKDVFTFVIASLDNFRLNPWQPHEPPLILTESRGNAKVLERFAGAYCCPIAGFGGQSGAGFLRTEVAPVLTNNKRIVLYLGDHDLSGDHIEANARRILERVTGREIVWERIGITAAQIRARRIEPILKIDNRFTIKTQRKCWECEALGQETIENLVVGALEERLAQMCKGRTLKRVRDREKRQVREARPKLQALKTRK